MKRTNTFLIIPFLLCFLFACQSSSTKNPEAQPEKRNYIRYEEEVEQDKLLTRIVEFHHPQTKQVITLVGMVHLGQESFYRDVEEICNSSQIILTEGVSGRGNFTPYSFSLWYMLSGTERVADITGLTLQRDAIQYNDKMLNADITLKELSSKRSWGESSYQVLLTPFVMIGSEIYFLSAYIEDLLIMPFTELRQTRQLARQKTLFAHSEKAAEMSAKINKSIIDDRNQYLLNKLDEVKNAFDSIAIPWGAAHGPGIEKGLLERGYIIKKDYWIPVLGHRKTEKANGSWQFNIPWIIRTGRNSQGVFHLSLLADFFIWHKGQQSALCIGWQQLYYNTPNEGGLLPQFFDRPLLWDWQKNNDHKHHRWLIFFGDE